MIGKNINMFTSFADYQIVRNTINGRCRQSVPGRLFLLLLIASLMTAGVTAENILTNPGFEDGDTTGWTNWGCGLMAVSDQVHSGNYSVLAYNRTHSWQGPVQSVFGAVEDGKTYKISGWVRLQNTDSDSIGVTVQQLDADGASYYGPSWATAYNDRWVQLSGYFTLNVNGLLEGLDIYFEGPAADVNFYLDDAEVELVDLGAWKADANDRIEQIRKRDVEIIVVDSVGFPVSDVLVQAEQTRHRFAFGSEIDNKPINDINNMDNPDYTGFFKNHFEWAVMGDESKWYSNEPSQGHVTYEDADIIYNWCTDNGIIMRGHCIYWEADGSYQQQPWVEGLAYAPLPAASELRTAVENRMDSAVNHFKGKFVHWDVNNEMLSPPHFFQSRLGQDIWYWMFRQANAIDPDCKLFTNEYSGNSYGGYHAQIYIDLVNDLRDNGAPVHGIGIQAHVSPTFNPINYWDSVLKPLGTLGLPIWVTEFDYQEADVSLRAEGLENFYRICFSDPNVEGILMWGFWENCHWRDDCYIVNADWSLNEAGMRYEALMDEWTTNYADTTDSSGRVDFRGFHGDYQVTLSIPGVITEVETIKLEPADAPAVFVLKLEGLGKPGVYAILRSSIDGGGGTGAGGRYSLTGTIGQAAAAYSANGKYELFGGF